MGKLPNIPRAEARAAGLKFFTTPEPCVCGCDQRYVSNAACVDCSISAGRARYAALDFEKLADMKARDAARYRQRIKR